MTLKDELPRSVGAQYATRAEWEIAPEGMKRMNQSRTTKNKKQKNNQLWMCLVVKVKSSAIENNIA